MTARKIAVVVVLCGVAVYFLVNWGIEHFRGGGAEPEPDAAPEPDQVVEDARLETTTSLDGLAEAEAAAAVPWRIAFASRDIPIGCVVNVGEFGDDAGGLTVRQRGDVVASELSVVAHRDDLPDRTIAAYVGDLGDEFTLEGVTLLLFGCEEA